MFTNRKQFMILVGALVLSSIAVVHGQNRMPATPPSADTARTSRTPNGLTSRTGPKPYREVITDKAQTQRGLFSVHKVDDKFYLEIPNRLLYREMLVVNRIGRGAANVKPGNGFMGFAGDIISELVVRFIPGPDNKVFLNKMSYRDRSRDSTSDMYRSVANSNIPPIVYAFDVKAYSNDSSASVIEITPLISTDNDLLFFDAGDKRSYGLSSLQADKSYVLTVRSFPTNLNFRTVKTYGRTAGSPIPGIPSLAGGDPATFEINNSFVLLPDDPMIPRFADERVGYFTTSFTDYDENPQGIAERSYIKRWRLEPKAGDEAKYLRGELVEPKKPIVFYIDPATPGRWVPYLIQGVNDWQKAFEAAGFKNAIVARVAPTYADDSTWLIEDARYSAIVYKPSTVQNASGPSTMDPRTGEILESHINWYHNVMRLLRDWYFIQASPNDPGARKTVFDDELMGQLIRFVSSHEVGHTLGLRHNFGSSSQVPVALLRNKEWVEKNGHTPSIMDYARFNYVAQPEDKIDRVGIFPRIGDYDLWAIKWGYTWYPNTKTAAEEKERLTKMATDSLKNPRLWFGDGETYGDDPRNQTEDLGNNSMEASKYGVKNLQRIIPNLMEWAATPGEDYEELTALYNNVVNQLNRYSGHVRRNIGGLQRTPKITGQAGSIYSYTPERTQKEAMAWLHEYIFKTPDWLLVPAITGLTNISPQETVLRLQTSSINSLMSASTANKLMRFEAERGVAEAYTLNEMMTDLRKGIFSELAARRPVDIYRRALQKTFTEKLIDIVNPPPASASPLITLGRGGASLSPSSIPTSDLISVAKAQAKSLQSEMRAAIPTSTDPSTRMHYADLADRIEKALKAD